MQFHKSKFGEAHGMQFDFLLLSVLDKTITSNITSVAEQKISINFKICSSSFVKSLLPQ